ncbi:hypothetical protein [Acetobacter indonesiensis]|nr:hypothetical protein [Acetobacter indonesiensis]
MRPPDLPVDAAIVWSTLRSTGSPLPLPEASAVPTVVVLFQVAR